MREVCAELAGTGIPVGVVPAGTGNLLGRNLDLPLYFRSAIDVALNGQDRAIDMVRIEGDNLEVLKLLQKSYAGKVKLIYIDPPYNTGKDFVYPDNFQDNIRNYLKLTGQVDGGQKMSSNTEANGRFHTEWLNMMYPRLKLARTLLHPSGVVFISIDDNEVVRLIFAEEGVALLPPPALAAPTN